MRTHFIAVFASLALLLMGPYALANDAYEAWEDKRYDEALQGFLDQQIESPNNRDLGMNVGSAHYMLGDFDKTANQLNYSLKMGHHKNAQRRSTTWAIPSIDKVSSMRHSRPIRRP